MCSDSVRKGELIQCKQKNSHLTGRFHKFTLKALITRSGGYIINRMMKISPDWMISPDWVIITRSMKSVVLPDKRDHSTWLKTFLLGTKETLLEEVKKLPVSNFC